MSEEPKPRTHSSRWVKGQSGNPSGRPKTIGHVRDLARAYTEAAIEKLAQVMNDPKTPKAVQIEAAKALLDRGHGRPEQAMHLTDDTTPRFSAIEYRIVEPPQPEHEADAVKLLSGEPEGTA